jgi:uncharacterized protein DUF6455
MSNLCPSLPNEIYGLARRMASHRLFHRMIARQQIELDWIHWADMESSIYRGLHTCSHCPAKAACTAWFASNEPSSSYVRFCPNAETIETLRIMSS